LNQEDRCAVESASGQVLLIPAISGNFSNSPLQK